MTTKSAKLFINGGSQAVRLPAEFRFDADAVYVRRDPATGDVVLSRREQADWAAFMKLRAELGCAPDDFLADRGQQSEPRNPLDGLVG